MRKKLLAILGVIMLVVAFMPSSSALAYGTKYKGLYVDPSHTGLRAIISTGSSTGSPPRFSFSALSPDSHWQVWQYYLNPSYACVFAGTEFLRAPGGSTTRNFFIYDNCSSTYKLQTSLENSSFRSAYVRLNTWNDTGTSFQDENYDMRIIQTSANWWTVYLYNYNTSTWDSQYAVWGSTTLDTGGAWFMDAGGTQQESGAYCPTLYARNIMQFRGMQYRNSGGTWITLGSGDIGYYNDAELCFTNNTYKITTPQPYQWKMLPYGASY